MNQAEYKKSEISRTRREIAARWKELSAEERAEAQRDWRETLRDPAFVEQRTLWLLLANYDMGAAFIARAAVWRMLRELRELLAAVETSCVGDPAHSAFAELEPAERSAINRAVLAGASAFIEREGSEPCYPDEMF